MKTECHESRSSIVGGVIGASLILLVFAAQHVHQVGQGVAAPPQALNWIQPPARFPDS
ncbi:hypothetical protein RM531_11060 [Salinisphaera sp. P385]|uniref:Uncharacterized protein n=1 Tax=Spectribacter acetivorans TaxID=3075603 RepID=A0ABU3B964_9GAMM|nr:hypothetical protein [Salinisphaera sp. P385]MDT0619016.1 hypothetical protein [Salinisphaera sp. P385]